MSKSNIGHADLLKHLSTQLEFLKRSCKAFDEGFKDESKRIATAIRILFHSTDRSHSLLAQLDMETRKFLDTSLELVEGNKLGDMPLISAGIGGKDGSVFFAPLSDTPFKRWIPAKNWWRQTVFRYQEGHLFSRKRLILTMANQDGGAHVDPKLDDEYTDIVDNAFGFRFVSNEVELVPNDATAETTRQIAHEVLTSLLPDYTPDRADISSRLIVGGASFTETSELRKKIGRNKPCPCNSGLKYKHCHGSTAVLRR